MTERDINSLLKKYMAGQCTAEEDAFLKSWYNDLEKGSPAPEQATDFDAVQLRTLQNLKAKHPAFFHTERDRSRKLYKVLSAAAAILLIMLTATWLFKGMPRSDRNIPINGIPQDIAAGSNKATLTLANGQRIMLGDATTGAIARQAGVTITKSTNGRIVYNASNPSPSDDSTFNTITTPNGGQYQVILPDGSKVWLNAASSLKYPISFSGNQRKVTLSGEAYFEISKNPKKPFFVSSADQTIRVLGTHFNLSSYAEEPVRTTLAEGKIEISQPSIPQKTILLPGDESTVTRTGLSIRKVDPEDAIAWKDGLFIFSNTDLKSVLRQVARWYDVGVDYNAIPDMKYYGELPRDLSLLKVLELIATGSNVPLKLEGRRIISK